MVNRVYLTLFSPESLRQKEERIGSSHLTWTELELVGSKLHNVQESPPVAGDSILIVRIGNGGSPQVIGVGSVKHFGPVTETTHPTDSIQRWNQRCFGDDFPYDFFCQLEDVAMFPEPLVIKDLVENMFGQSIYGKARAHLRASKSVIRAICPMKAVKSQKIPGTLSESFPAWQEILRQANELRIAAVETAVAAQEEAEADHGGVSAAVDMEEDHAERPRAAAMVEMMDVASEEDAAEDNARLRKEHVVVARELGVNKWYRDRLQAAFPDATVIPEMEAKFSRVSRFTDIVVHRNEDDWVHIEIKCASNWQHAIGQVLSNGARLRHTLNKPMRNACVFFLVDGPDELCVEDACADMARFGVEVLGVYDVRTETYAEYKPVY